MIHRTRNTRRPLKHRQRGNATAETIVALVALLPFLIGIPMLGKQLDIKHKSYDATRYSVWERTVYRSDGARKNADEIAIDARDRTLGNPRAGITDNATLQTAGVTENPLWRDRGGERLLVERRDGQPQPFSFNQAGRESPVEVGAATVPQIAYHGNAVTNAIMTAVGVDSLGFDRNSFATASVTLRVRPVLLELADQPLALGAAGRERERPPLEQTAAGGILSDTWGPSSEGNLRGRIDSLVANERMWQAEMPGMVLGFLGGKGTALYGEGQFGMGRGFEEGPDLTAPSTTLPNNYVYTPRR
jgi:hypothetical protein